MFYCRSRAFKKGIFVFRCRALRPFLGLFRGAATLEQCSTSAKSWYNHAGVQLPNAVAVAFRSGQQAPYLLLSTQRSWVCCFWQRAAEQHEACRPAYGTCHKVGFCRPSTPQDTPNRATFEHGSIVVWPFFIDVRQLFGFKPMKTPPFSGLTPKKRSK